MEGLDACKKRLSHPSHTSHIPSYPFTSSHTHSHPFTRLRFIYNTQFCQRYRSIAKGVEGQRAVSQSDEGMQQRCRVLVQAIVSPNDDSSSSGVSNSGSSGNSSGTSSSGTMIVTKESIQVGLTKVFLRKVAHDVLERRRTLRLALASRTIQVPYPPLLPHTLPPLVATISLIWSTRPNLALVFRPSR